jgi:hypothetical protein
MSTAPAAWAAHKPARPVANAADITEMVRGLIRYINKAGMSPEEAIEKAKELFEGPTIELWCGAPLVTRILGQKPSATSAGVSRLFQL